ncbi:MAG: phycobilisome linker polypeptide [Cyanobacteria bacterium P01_D01_bin.123]
MLGQYATSQASSVDSRIFVYEVTGLAQNEVTANNQFPIRSSDSQFIQVPFHRMNEFMRRVTIMGGEIVSIRPLQGSD